MKEEKLVSVYINVYNREDYILETLRSVVSQTYQNLQIIVVDDCSDDGTAANVRSLADERIELYQLKENQHVVGALNEGLKHVRGDYAAHVDSDDLWAPDKIEKQVRFLEEHPEYGSCFTLVDIIDENGNDSEGNEVINRNLFAMDNLSQARMLRDFVDRSNHLNHSSMMVRREVLDKVGGYGPAYQYLHDFDLWIRFCLEKPVYVMQERLVRYRVHSGNISDPEAGRGNAYKWEFSRTIRSLIEQCPDRLFVEAFTDKLKKQPPLSAAEIQIEKAFVLLGAFTVNQCNPILGIRKLDDLMSDPEMKKILKEQYGFTVASLYALHREFTYFYPETDQLQKEQIRFLQESSDNGYREIVSLQGMVGDRDHMIQELQDIIRNRDIQLTRANVQLNSVNEKNAQLSRPFGKVRNLKGKLNSAKTRTLKDGRPAAKKLMLYGFFGHNLGDDLFFDMLLKRYPDVLFDVCCSSAYITFFSVYNNVRHHADDSSLASKMNQIGKKLGKENYFESVIRSHTDGGVHIGGSVYQQIGDWEKDLKDRNERYEKGKCFFGISNNFGPYQTEDYRMFWKQQFENWNDVCFRDHYSKELFAEVGTVRYAPDALFVLPLGQLRPQENGRIAVSVIDPEFELRGFSKEQCDAYEQFLCEFTETMILQGHKVSLLGFCGIQNDAIAMSRITDYLNAKDPEMLGSVSTSLYWDSPEEMLNEIAKCEYVLATRFHAMVLGLMMGKKVLPVCYSQKTLRVIRDMQLVQNYIDLTDPDSYPSGDILACFESLEEKRHEEIRAAAQEQFLVLDRYLNYSPEK